MRARLASGVGRCLLLVLALLIFPGPSQAAAGEFAAYASLLERHVRPGRIGSVALHTVDYAAVAGDPLYKRALADLAAANPARPDKAAADVDDGSAETVDESQIASERAAGLAFWINAYNLLAIKVVVDHYPVESIRDVGSFLWPVWKRSAGVVGGKAYTLDEIEHGILRPRFQDPRVHMAIVCASVSCPDLRQEPYQAARIDEQLDDATRNFLSNRAKGVVVEEDTGNVALSSIFRWFSDDFSRGGGILAFVRARAPADVADRAKGLRDADVRWLDYDWSLNDRSRAR